MNVLLWILQILLALHTIMGALWKFSHSAEQTMPSLKAIPHGVWLAMSLIELLCAVALILPAVLQTPRDSGPDCGGLHRRGNAALLRAASFFRCRGSRPDDLLARGGCHLRVHCLRQICAKAFLRLLAS